MKNALSKTLSSVKWEGKVPFSSEGERAGCSSPVLPVVLRWEAPFFKDQCAIAEIELAEPAWGTNSPFIKTKENLPELLGSTQLD